MPMGGARRAHWPRAFALRVGQLLFYPSGNNFASACTSPAI